MKEDRSSKLPTFGWIIKGIDILSCEYATHYISKPNPIKLQCFTFAKVGKWLKDPPPESCHRVLDTGAQTQHALEVGLFQQQLPVRTELVCSAQQGSDTMHKLWYQASVRVIRLAVVICHHLEHKEEGENQMKTECFFRFK